MISSMAKGAMLALGLAAAMAAGQAHAFPQPKYAPTAPSGQPPKPAPAQAPVSTAKPALAGAKAWSIYVVQKGDTLTGVSRRFGASVATLADINELDAKAALKPGLKIKLPPGAADKGQDPYASGPSPLSFAQSGAQSGPAPAPTRPKPVSAVHVSSAPAEPARTPPPSSTPAAETPPPARPKPTPVVHSFSAPPPAADAPPPARPTPVKPAVTTAALAPAPPIAESAPGVSDASTSGHGRFIWPLKGDILLAFGPISQGQRNDGINIGAQQGVEVKAAADGVVVYAGAEVKGYGNTVLIMHPGGWDTVYTHLDKIEVGNRGFPVKQGQVIGTVGSTGDVDQPQLHFETRFSPDPHHKYNPVDPLSVLPQ